MADNKKTVKAVGLLSGGLDSTLAAKMMIDQGIEVIAVNFTSPFCTCTPKSSGCSAVIKAVEQLGNIPLKRFSLSDDYIEIVRSPEHGHGRGMNPCIDCRILKIKKAGEYMKEIGASFLFTGEVLGQRPMSQHRRAIKIIDKSSGYEHKILRPLSAGFFEPTFPEKMGFVKRERLLSISGRGRKKQISLSKDFKITDYPCPAGGCLLTDKAFSEKIKDYFKYEENPAIKDIPLLKTGRHFRQKNGDKIIVAKNESQCKSLINLCREDYHLFIPTNFSGPSAILMGDDINKAVKKLLHYVKGPVPRDAVIEHIHKGGKSVLEVNNYLIHTSI